MDNDSDKGAYAFDQIEKLETGRQVASDEVIELTESEGKKIIHRIDRRLLVTIGFMYCISLIDRTNISLAAIAGLAQDLVLTGNRYSIATLAFFPTYIVFQPTSTVLVRKLGPRIHIAFITAAWGAVMLGMGFVQTFGALTALRVLIGILEAGFFPSAVYLLSTWYTRYELGRRYGLFYLIGSVTSAFSGIIAFGITHLEGAGGLRGWRWIFVIEGILTVLLGIAGYWLLVDFPDSDRKNWKFLSEQERAWVVNRVNADRGDAETPKFRLGHFLRAGLDWRLWAYGVIAFGSTTVTYALAFFLPIILNENLGFDVGASQALVAPPYAFAGLFMYAMGWLGDKYRMRGPIVVINMVVSLIGLPLLGWHPDAKVRYFGSFLLVAGANSNVPASLAYQATNIRGQWKRAFASATWVGFGGIGGIAGSLVFRAEDKPDYRPGLWACIAVCVLNILVVGVCTLSFYLDNKKADRGEKELEAEDEGFQPGFRYTY
ncbi:major facilitator superfamily domain-containing protein [Xylaria bambusicola]|uniref:major facilitator superfamily domain-containing protein n=1 Tax=Xylaria bambusicola TaxID=326684 RepID=UPI0020082506|nr:major facilitator superfamily domain-containing protein [Xylaria bambusicola]KAI0526416.1 major facilitator superfamily domain-containing protein [Xylaria bambusicola]